MITQIGASLLAAAALSWLALMVAWTVAGTPVIGMFSDSVWYLEIADFYRSQLGGDTPVHAMAAYDASRFPPLYSLVIATVGGGIGNQDVVNHLSIVLTLTAGAMVVGWLYTIGIRLLAALAALPLVYVTPALADWLLIPLSEPLFLTCLVAGLIAAQRARDGKLDVLVVAATISVLPLVRSAGIVLVVAFAAWLIRVPRVSHARRAMAAGIALGPAALWALHRSTKPVVLDYGGEVSLDRMIEQGGTIGAFVMMQISAIGDALQSWFGVSGPGMASLGVVTLGVAAALGWWLRFRSWELDAIFVPLYFGMLLVWPYPLEMPRLVGVIMPIVAAWAILGAARCMHRPPLHMGTARTQAALACAGIAALLALPAWASSFNRAMLPVDPDLEPYKRTPAYFIAPDPTTARAGLETSARTLAVIDESTRLIRPDECVYTTQTALVTAVSGGRLRVRPTPVLTSEQPIENQLNGCRYLLIMQLGSRQAHAAPLYPINEAGDVLVPVLISRRDTPNGQAVAAALLERSDHPH